MKQIELPKKYKAAFALLTALLASSITGCSANFEYAKMQGVNQVSKDVFEVFSEDHRGVFGSDSSNQRYVVEEANAFAEKQGMVAVPLEARNHRVGILGDWGWAYYKFRLVPRSDRMLSKQLTEIQFEGDARMSNSFLSTRDRVQNTTSAGAPLSSKPSLYEELLKLDELKKRGIITEVEFEPQKKKLLDAQ